MARVPLKLAQIAFIDNLWKPGANSRIANSQEAFGATFIIEPGSDNDKNIREAIHEVAVAKFKSRADFILDEIKYNKNCMCYMEGDRFQTEDGRQYNGYAGKMVLKTRRRKNDGAPSVVDRAGNPLPDSGILYSGCFVDASVEPFAYMGKPSNGISCGLIAVRFMAQGPSFGGASPVTLDGLPPIEDEFDDDEPF